MPGTPDNRRGIVLMLVAMACYTLNDACIRLVSTQLGTGQILALRGLCASAIVLALTASRGVWRHWRTLAQPLIGLRALLEVATALCSVLALARMPLATVTAIMLTAPLMIAITSMACGMEPRRTDRVLATLVGLGGTLLVLRPALETRASGLAFAFGCAVGLAARDLVNRRIPAKVPTPLIASPTTVAVMVGGLALIALPGPEWQPLAPATAAWLAAAAVVTALGNMAVVAASRGVDLSVVAPFRYSSILWALLLGQLLLGEPPDGRTGIGVALITASGAYLLHAARRPL